MARLAPDVLLLRQEQGCGCVSIVGTLNHERQRTSWPGLRPVPDASCCCARSRGMAGCFLCHVSRSFRIATACTCPYPPAVHTPLPAGLCYRLCALLCCPAAATCLGLHPKHCAQACTERAAFFPGSALRSSPWCSGGPLPRPKPPRPTPQPGQTRAERRATAQSAQPQELRLRQNRSVSKRLPRPPRALPELFPWVTAETSW